MSLATRCTACGTIFRVVQDQLRVSEGWVRCGRCAEVFDAREQLFDIDLEAPPPWPADSPVQAFETQHQQIDVALAPEAPTWHQASDATDVFVDAMPPSPPAHAAAPSTAWASEPESELAPAPEPGFVATPRESGFDSQLDSRLNSRLEPQWVDEDSAAAVASAQLEPSRSQEPEAANDVPATDDGPDVVLTPRLAEMNEARNSAAEPSFMRRTNSAQHWRRPSVRVALGGMTVVLLALFAAQVAHHFHDAIVAVYPSTRQSMQALCEVSGCELRPWQRIDAVGVENSALNQAGAGNQYQLVVSLHNKSSLEVAMPWVELNLIDTAGAVVIRRMLAPADFKAAKPSLSAGADLPLQVLLTTGPQKISGYSVEIFHP